MDPHLFLKIGDVLNWVGLALSPLLLVPLITLIIPRLIAGFAARLSAVIDHITGLSLWAAIVSAVALVFLQLISVIMSYAFGVSWTWLSELVIYAFAAMFMLGTASALRDDAHVRVDILRPRFGERGRAWIELAGIFLFLFPIAIRLLALSEQGLTRSWLLFEGSRESDGLPIVFLFKTLVPVFACLLLIQGLSEAIKAALILTDRRHETPPHAAGDSYGA